MYYTLELSQKKASAEELPGSDWLSTFLWGHCLYWKGPAHAGGTIPRHVVLGRLRKQAKHGSMSEPESEVASLIPLRLLACAPAPSHLTMGRDLEV